MATGISHVVKERVSRVATISRASEKSLGSHILGYVLVIYFFYSTHLFSLFQYVTFLNTPWSLTIMLTVERSDEIYTKYEKARIIGARALQISQGAPILVKLSEEDFFKLKFNPIEIAKRELDAGVMPITVDRTYRK